MKIKKLKLFTTKLALEKVFYAQTLGFEIVESNPTSFTVKVGWSYLTFETSEKEYTYHYCFLIPSNKLDQALEWMEERVSVIAIENGCKTQHFESWNADSFYFYDASGNIVEFIARHELANEILSDFDLCSVLCVNEIGMPTKHVARTNDALQKHFGTAFWKGDIDRFGTNGSQEGLFLLPNYAEKEFWFPTLMKISPAPFEIVIENNGATYSLEYRNEQILLIGN